MSSSPLAKAQDKWAEQLLQDSQLFDCVAVLGPEGQRVSFVGALLANVSEPLKQALFGEFREGKSKEVVLADVTPSAFQAILRAAVHLDPKLTPENVVPTMQAASMYMINDLMDACVKYASNIKVDDIMTVLSTAAKEGFALPQDVCSKCWCTILLKSTEILAAPSFLSAHGSIIMKLVKLEEFEVTEENLWSRLVEWTSAAVTDATLLGPLQDALPKEPASKRARTESSDAGSTKLAQQTAVLQALAVHIRFVTMGREFFIDKARSFLTREDSDSIMTFHLLGRLPPKQIASKRCGLRAPEELLPFLASAKSGQEEADKLQGGNAAWQVSATCVSLSVKLPFAALVSKVKLTFAGNNPTWSSWKVYNHDRVHRVIALEVKEQQIESSRTIVKIIESSTLPVKELGITYEGTAPQNASPVAKVEIFGSKTRATYAADVAKRLAADDAIPSQSQET